VRQLIILAIMLLLNSVAVYADGLIYKLPEDGTSIDYEMKVLIALSDLPVSGFGTVSISSVGQVVVDNEKCRWLEFKMEVKMPLNQRTVISKLLIPEKHLGRGKSPIYNVKKCWFKQDAGEVRELRDVKSQLDSRLVTFLSGPLKDLKKLEQEVIHTKLGGLSCEGSIGRFEFQQGNTTLAAEIEARLHDKAPFGVVTLGIELGLFDQDGLPIENMYVTLKLTDVNKNAKSELPNVN